MIVAIIVGGVVTVALVLMVVVVLVLVFLWRTKPKGIYINFICTTAVKYQVSRYLTKYSCGSMHRFIVDSPQT